MSSLAMSSVSAVSVAVVSSDSRMNVAKAGW
jgi:hypothetical protein